MEKTNFDVRLRYDEIDQWAHVSSDFPARINRKIAESIAISLITVGMNGTSRAANSNFTQNQLLQDVAKGWLQKMREENAARVLGKASEKVKYGPGATEYKNLDAVVTDVLNELMDERFADRSDFVVLASRRTVGDKYLRVVNASGDKATELEAGGRLSEKRTLGGLPVMYVPNMPANTLLITPLSNLSIYYQVSGERRHIKDVPEKDQIECYQSKNIDFIVEEYGAAALVEYLSIVWLCSLALSAAFAMQNLTCWLLIFGLALHTGAVLWSGGNVSKIHPRKILPEAKGWAASENHFRRPRGNFRGAEKH